MTDEPDLSHLTPEKRMTARAVIATRAALISEGTAVSAIAISGRMAEFHERGRSVSRRQLYDDAYLDLWQQPGGAQTASAELKRASGERDRLRKRRAADAERIAALEKLLAEKDADIARRIDDARRQDERIQTLLAGFVDE